MAVKFPKLDGLFFIRSVQRGLFIFFLTIAFPAFSAPQATAVQDQNFLVLAYTDITAPNAAILFKQQMVEWRNQGYQAVSIDDVIAAQTGKKPLPAKALLLSFDVATSFFATQIFPTLAENHIPAILAVDDAEITRDRRHAYLSWAQLRRLTQSGVITLATRGHALGDVIANPQGDREPAAVTLPYDAQKHRYATPAAFDRTLATNLESAAQVIARFTGSRPRIMAWPDGVYSGNAVDLAKHHRMAINLTLDAKTAHLSDLSVIPRLSLTVAGGAEALKNRIASLDSIVPMRAIQADIDYVYDADAAQMQRNIDDLIARVKTMGVNAVFLQAFADPQGSEVTSQTYFPNPVLPMRADLFNHIAWLLKTRAGVKVYGWIPMFSFNLGDKVTQVMHWDLQAGKALPTTVGYHRASVFDPRARKIIIDLFADMARHGPIDGVLYHDDAMFSDFEDASPPALAAYKKARLPDSIMAIRADPAMMDKWTAFKTSTLIDFTEEITGQLRQIRGHLLTVRNIYASPVLNVHSEEWYAQSYQQFMHAYDMTAIEAMPQMEEVPDDQAVSWMENLIKKAAATEPDALQKTLFELQSVDWRKAKKGENRAIATEVLAAQMRMLSAHGALNFGYYPDDFHANIPNAAVLSKDFAVTP